MQLLNISQKIVIKIKSNLKDDFNQFSFHYYFIEGTKTHECRLKNIFAKSRYFQNNEHKKMKTDSPHVLELNYVTGFDVKPLDILINIYY
jgi:hypothetical protein